MGKQTRVQWGVSPSTIGKNNFSGQSAFFKLWTPDRFASGVDGGGLYKRICRITFTAKH